MYGELLVDSGTSELQPGVYYAQHNEVLFWIIIVVGALWIILVVVFTYKHWKVIKTKRADFKS